MGVEATSPRVIVALDYPDAASALAFVARISPEHCRLKIGFELFVAAGPELVAELGARGFDVFLDLKFHDIPNTVASACRRAAQLGVWMLNVHAAGGEAMLRAAREAVDVVPTPPLLIAVTVLTSMSDADLPALGVAGSAADQVRRLAALSQACGLDGVVCSAQEAGALRDAHGSAFLRVTPGIRPLEAARDDQQRVTTPEEAVRIGASYLVIGRPITRAADPAAALDVINTALEPLTDV
jgi:orotidine-5'-phosphate decarboxylase